MEIQVNTKQRTYAIHLEKGSLHRVKEIIKPKGRVFIISDDGVPEKWQNILLEQFPEAPVHIFKNGEASKNMQYLRRHPRGVPPVDTRHSIPSQNGRK